MREPTPIAPDSPGTRTSRTLPRPQDRPRHVRARVNIRAVIQARTGSTRLPNKILMDIAGKTMLERVIERCHQIRGLDGPPIVAFAQNVPEACDAICEKAGADVRRG